MTTRRSPLTLIPFLTVTLLFVGGAGDLAVPQQPKSPAKANPSGATPLRPMTSKETKFVEAALEEIGAMTGQVQEKDWEKNFHKLVDQALDGKGLPESMKVKFQSITNPDREKVHQFIDREMARLKEELQQRKSPANQKGSRLEGERLDSSASQMALNPDQSLHPYARRVNLAPVISTLASPQASFDQRNEQSFLVGWREIVSSSKHEGNLEITEKGGGFSSDENFVGMGLDAEITVNGSKGDTSISAVTKKSFLDKVDRCPKADGLVSGTVDVGTHIESSGRDGTRDMSGYAHFEIKMTATGHVGDDARLKEKVTFEFETNVNSQSVNEKNVKEVSKLRYWGDGEFNPKGGSEVVRLKGCIVEAGNPADCTTIASSITSKMFPGIFAIELQYQEAEKKWNLDDTSDNSDCLTSKFTPKTKTVRKKPGEPVDVKIELLTKKGNQPTWGKIEQLEAVKGDGKVSPTSAAFTSDKPVQVTYTAPPKPWPPNDPPGFDIVKATSRAGVIKRGQSLPKDVEWRLATAIRLAIHQRFELLFARAPGVAGGVLSDVRFFLDLAIEPDGRLSGQAVVPREERQNTAAVISGLPMTCQQRNTWTELWEAKGKLDEASQQLMFKLRFDVGPKNIMTSCKTPNGDMQHQWATGPGTRSDSMKSPLDSLVMAAKDGELRKYEFPVPPAKTLIEIKVVTGEGDPPDQPTPPPTSNPPAPSTPPSVIMPQEVPKEYKDKPHERLGPTDEKKYLK